MLVPRPRITLRLLPFWRRARVTADPAADGVAGGAPGARPDYRQVGWSPDKDTSHLRSTMAEVGKVLTTVRRNRR
jgi:hypothetical protein